MSVTRIAAVPEAARIRVGLISLRGEVAAASRARAAGGSA